MTLLKCKSKQIQVKIADVVHSKVLIIPLSAKFLLVDLV